MKKTILLWLIAIAVAFVIITGLAGTGERTAPATFGRNLITQAGVCPPFFLFDEAGALIDPVHDINSNKPYSPRQTCGKCHDYERITQGFHFQQGKDEAAAQSYTDRYQWVTHPGNYGGNWCSPAPLYNYLSQKQNTGPREMDMTSFTFITSGCGSCHPGGGPLEYDRNGYRYDRYMDSVGYTAGGINDYDGDYYKSHWNRSGVAEGDCNMCHYPEYDFKERNAHLAKWNFRWMATAGSGLARVDGSVKDNTQISLVYDLRKFDNEGKLSMHLVREPRNQACLNCHSKPQWKKRGASFTPFTDVHIAKGLKCVDCHPAGSMAVDPRINGKETHQFGKGDDPGGQVRNDLDNTMRTCEDCHISGYLNAPIASHNWLPALHLEKLSCQACHIPQRKVKSALVQTSDVFNPGTKINPPSKYIWTFYDQYMAYWNHYGELSMFTAADQPTDPFVPVYARYKGKIFPINAVHSAWPGIETEGKPGLHQPRMKDIYEMWISQRTDSTQYALLSVIRDDNLDGIPEVNRAEEIDAFIESVSSHLQQSGYDLDSGRRVVWVNNDRIYYNGNQFKLIDKELHESSPYASVHKYSHDVFPARAALGSRSCTECHSSRSDFFFAQVVRYPFGDDAKPVYEIQYEKLGLAKYQVWSSVVREQYIKPVSFVAMTLLLLWLLLSLILHVNLRLGLIGMSRSLLYFFWTIMLAFLVLVFLRPDLHSYILPEPIWIDSNHFYICIVAFLAGVYFWMDFRNKHQRRHWVTWSMGFFVGLAFFSGVLMLLKWQAIDTMVRVAYTLFDTSILLLLLASIVLLMQCQNKTVANQELSYHASTGGELPS